MLLVRLVVGELFLAHGLMVSFVFVSAFFVPLETLSHVDGEAALRPLVFGLVEAALLKGFSFERVEGWSSAILKVADNSNRHAPTRIDRV